MKIDEEFRQLYIARFKGKQHDRRDVCLFAEALVRAKLLEFATAIRSEEIQAGSIDSEDRLFARDHNQCVREINQTIDEKLLKWGIGAQRG